MMMLCSTRPPLLLMKRSSLLVSFFQKRRNIIIQKRRDYSVLAKSENEISTIREHLREFGSATDEDTITFQLTSELDTDDSSSNNIPSSPLSNLGTSTGVITIRNPSSRNALTGKMMAEFSDIVYDLQSNSNYQESLSSIIVRGHNNFFCAGADVGVAKDHLLTKDGGRLMSSLMIDTLTKFRNLPFVTVAAIEGAAIGGGAELTTAMDYRIAHSNAKLRFVHAHMGVSPGWGGATRLVKLVGRQRSLELLGTAQPCTAQQGMEIGLIDKIVDVVAAEDSDDASTSSATTTTTTTTMDETLVQFLDRFVHSHPQVLHAAKTVVSNCEDSSSFDDAVSKEHEVFLTMWGGDANRAALARGGSSKSKKK